MAEKHESTYLPLYNHAELNLAFRKFSVLSYVKEILVDNKHFKKSGKSQFRNRISYAIVFSVAKMAFHKK